MLFMICFRALERCLAVGVVTVYFQRKAKPGTRSIFPYQFETILNLSINIFGACLI